MSTTAGAYNILIRSQWCKKCGICVDLCPRGVLSMLAGEVPRPTSLLDCNGCGTCEIMCPDLAVTVQEVICDAATVDAR